VLVTKPRKQRKMLFQAPLHRRYRLFSAPLAPELRKSRGVRSLPLRVGDTVMITRGDHKGFEGKVTRVDRKKYRVFIEGLTREKVDGTTIFVGIHPSKVMITKLNLDDKWREKILERKKAAEKKIEEAKEEKPEKKAETQKKPEPKKPKARKTPAKDEKKKEEKGKPKAKKTKRKTKRKAVKRAKKTAGTEKEEKG